MNLIKNQEFNIEIIDMSVEGLGIGKIDSIPIFVKGAIIGDEVKCAITKVKKNLAYARIVEIINPSDSRVNSKCVCSRKCGGCQLQEMDYKAQLEFKTSKVLNNLKRIGGFDLNEIEDISKCIGMDEPYKYRNKTQIPYGYDNDGKLAAGFYAGRTHSIIPSTKCEIVPDEFNEIINIIKSFMVENNIFAYNETTHQGLIRHVLLRKGVNENAPEILVCIVINGNEIKNVDELILKLKKIEEFKTLTININRENTNVILGKETKVVYGDGFIIDSISDLKFQISPASFFQVNHKQTKKLYEIALNFAGLNGNEVVWDLYCGAGSISLFLARKSKQVYGVEIVSSAVKNAKENARINNIENAKFFEGKAEEIAPKFAKEKKYKPDIVVVDPPRKGCDKNCLDAILEMHPKRIVYVSCDSATLARDLKYLRDMGEYELKKVRMVDMFPHMVHVESVCLIAKDS